MNLEYIHTSEGRIRFSGDTAIYDYYLKDHLGNTRVVFTDNGTDTPEVQQVSNYYPFGMRFGETNQIGNETTDYLYNGKEFQDELGWYDYGARFYDAALGRFTTQDPMAIDYYSMSPYNYVANNPLKYIDPTGMWITSIEINEDDEGNKTATLMAVQEEGDDLNSLAEFLGVDAKEAKETYGSSFDKDESGDKPLSVAVQGKSADLVNEAFTHALNNPDDYAESFGNILGAYFGVDYGTNYNCFNGATSIAKGDKIDKDYIMDNTEVDQELNSNFTGSTDKNTQQYGKTVVLYGYYKGMSMHAGLYLGTDKSGNDYHFYKPGKVGAPRIIKSTETPNGYGDIQGYYTPKK